MPHQLLSMYDQVTNYLAYMNFVLKKYLTLEKSPNIAKVLTRVSLLAKMTSNYGMPRNVSMNLKPLHIEHQNSQVHQNH